MTKVIKNLARECSVKMKRLAVNLQLFEEINLDVAYQQHIESEEKEVKNDPDRNCVLILHEDEIKSHFEAERTDKSAELSGNNKNNSKICDNEMRMKKHDDSSTCKICKKLFSNKYCLNAHMKRLHYRELNLRLFECDFCGLRLKRKVSFVNHMKQKHEGGKVDEFECGFDGKKFKTKGSLYTHMECCHRPPKTCEICGKRVKQLQEHIKFQHQSENTKVSCQLCGKSFKNRNLVARHIKSHNKKFQCQVCGKKYENSTFLKQHSKIHDDPSAFQCKICHKKLGNQNSLWYHMKTHDENRKKPHKCQQCDYATDLKSKLKIHHRVHDQNRVKHLKCPHCDYTTDEKRNYKGHLETHNPNRVKFSCPYCNYEAATRSVLKQHIKCHDENRVKQFKCQQCDYATDMRGHLKRHMGMHDKICKINLKK
jgi:KRAB domain-containing zinc finger protein